MSKRHFGSVELEEREALEQRLERIVEPFPDVAS